MANKRLTTGEVARICSVTPNAVLKWIRAGYLPALRTAGGHYRIDPKDVETVLYQSAEIHAPIRKRSKSLTEFQYCWEYHGRGTVLDECAHCAVYLMRAKRCYEVAILAPESRHSRVFCQDNCRSCEYFQRVFKQDTNIIVVSSDQDLLRSLWDEAGQAQFNLEITDSIYKCSALISEFRPDFVIIDADLDADVTGFVRLLNEDPRIPHVRIVLAGSESMNTSDCEKEIFALVRKPFTVDDINRRISNTGWDRRKVNHKAEIPRPTTSRREQQTAVNSTNSDLPLPGTDQLRP